MAAFASKAFSPISLIRLSQKFEFDADIFCQVFPCVPVKFLRFDTTNSVSLIWPSQQSRKAWQGRVNQTLTRVWRLPGPGAYSSEVDAGSREENA
jgi:hypothetical protein